MGRKAKLRASYLDDAQFLFRLEDAIMRDDTRPLEWRREVALMTHALALRMAEAPPQKTSELKSAPDGGGSRRKKASGE